MNVRRLAVGLMTAVLVWTAPAAGNAGPGTARDTAATPGCADRAGSFARAMAMAVACGSPVVVDQSMTEVSRVVARPDGRLRFESAVLPQWTRRPDGSWADVDLRLRRAPDGSWRPAASVADVRFSSGGSGPLVTLVRDGR